MTPMARRAVAAAAAAVMPMVAALAFYAPAAVAWLCLGWGVLAMAIAWGVGRSLSRRIGDLISFANQMPHPAASRQRPQFDDDELGDLARSLARAAPQVEHIVHGLSTELARREAILASMTEGVLAVDARLNVSFCNEAFVRQVAGHPVPEGIALIKVFRDPGLFEVLRQVIESMIE